MLRGTVLTSGRVNGRERGEDTEGRRERGVLITERELEARERGVG